MGPRYAALASKIPVEPFSPPFHLTFHGFLLERLPLIKELFSLVDAHISPYPQANRLNHDPLRTRKLLLHKKEIKRLIGKVEQRGYTLIPIKLYFVDGKVKVDLALAKGKKLFDKRETLKKKTMEREMERGRKGFDGDR